MGISLIDSPRLVIVSFLVILLYLGAVRSKQLSLILVLKLNIEPLLTLLLSLYGYDGYFMIWGSVIPLLLFFIMIIVVPFRLLTMMSFMSALNIQRLIVTLFVIMCFRVPFIAFLFPPRINMRISSPMLIYSFAFVLLVVNSTWLIHYHLEFEEGCQYYQLHHLFLNCIHHLLNRILNCSLIPYPYFLSSTINRLGCKLAEHSNIKHSFILSISFSAYFGNTFKSIHRSLVVFT